MKNDKVLEVLELSKTFGEGESKTEALRSISFSVAEGEFLGIMGPSGSGKTTLLNCIATMIRPSSGKILLKGRDIQAFSESETAEYRGRDIGFIFQEFELLDNLTGRENIALPLALHGISPQSAEGEIMRLAEVFDIKTELPKFPTEMSGGQKQRVAAARALISNPAIVLADEPTGALDSQNAKTLMKCLSLACNTVMMVTHDANAASYCSRILFIRDGKLFHELRRNPETEAPSDFYARIVVVLSQMGGGATNVL
ncbi:MAG: ABC transporter ATP-binding protein [Ruminococcaceae bacterium]|nr:ABC transporter ATP-binding protein [Oscillospiraceae bacterium]